MDYKDWPVCIFSQLWFYDYCVFCNGCVNFSKIIDYGGTDDDTRHDMRAAASLQRPAMEQVQLNFKGNWTTSGQEVKWDLKGQYKKTTIFFNQKCQLKTSSLFPVVTCKCKKPIPTNVQSLKLIENLSFLWSFSRTFHLFFFFSFFLAATRKLAKGQMSFRNS